MRFSIEIEDEEVMRMIRAGDREYRQAGASALNRTAGHIKTRAIRGIVGRTQVPRDIVKRRLYTRRATRRILESAVLTYARSVNPLAAGAVAGDSGVTAPGHSWPRAFVAHGKKGRKSGSGRTNKQVFERRGRKRLPLDVHRIRIMDTAEDVINTVTERAAKLYLEKRLPHEIKYRLLKAAGRY